MNEHSLNEHSLKSSDSKAPTRMKKEISPKVAGVGIAAVVVILLVIVWRATSGSSVNPIPGGDPLTAVKRGVPREQVPPNFRDLCPHG